MTVATLPDLLVVQGEAFTQDFQLGDLEPDDTFTPTNVVGSEGQFIFKERLGGEAFYTASSQNGGLIFSEDGVFTLHIPEEDTLLFPVPPRLGPTRIGYFEAYFRTPQGHGDLVMQGRLAVQGRI